MIQEMFNTLKDLILHNESDENQEIHDDFVEKFDQHGKTQVEMIAFSPELNGEGKDNPEDYYEGLGYSLPITMYMMKRAMKEDDVLDEQHYIDTSETLVQLNVFSNLDSYEGNGPYQEHLNGLYKSLVDEIKRTHIKLDDTIDPENIRIPSQYFIENLTNKNIAATIEVQSNLGNVKAHNQDTIKQEI